MPNTLISTTDFATTAHIDFTITKDVIGGTQRRVTFTASAPGFVDATDGIDVSPQSTRMRCKVYHITGGQNLNDSTLTLLTWDGETFDVGGLHSTSTNPSRITVATGGDTGAWGLTLQVEFQANVNGDRWIEIRKNNVMLSQIFQRACSLASLNTKMVLSIIDDSPAVGDYYEGLAWQNSGGAFNVISGAQASNFSAVHLW